MYTVHCVLLKTVFTFQPTFGLVFTTVESARFALTHLIFLLRTETSHLCCLVVMVIIVVQKRRAWLWNRKSIAIFDKFFSHSQSSIPELLSKKAKIIPSFQLPKTHFRSEFIHFHSTLKQYNFLSLHRRHWMFSRVWTTIRYSNCKNSGPRNDNLFPWNSSGSSDLVVVSKTRFLNKNLV